MYIIFTGKNDFNLNAVNLAKGAGRALVQLSQNYGLSKNLESKPMKSYITLVLSPYLIINRPSGVTKITVILILFQGSGNSEI